ncbi:SDR family oxidoreductase [Georgenia sp. SYP-B2076]|uniref:SDR family oxidoreductase n=1 Tax=Georgenia sp. SYP-B2076 TaxID=2495881 RepID=UPI000F8EFA83|nr:SDR family oxidoreductase [Georgenia sp. SYP-B2076]
MDYYSGYEAGLIGPSRIVAGECSRFGVTVNTVAPEGLLIAGVQPADIIDEQMQQVPVGRIGAAAEVTHAVGFVRDDRVGFITGSVLDLNGAALLP